MSIVFGWNNFRIKSFKPQELGITQNQDPGYRIEIRQSYFHLFWIPFFGLGKKWAINKGGKLYELPADFEGVVRPLEREVRTPWYTYAGPLLMLAGGLIFWAYSEFQEYKYRQSSISYFNQKNGVLEDQLRHLTNKDIITFQEVSKEYWNEKMLYAKVENVSGETITVTPVSSPSNQPMDVEDSYMRFREQTPSFDIQFAQLMAAYPKKYDSSSGRALVQYGRKIMNNERSYIVKEVVHHFGPIIGSRGSGSYGIQGISMAFYNAGWPAVISGIKTLEGKVDWIENMGKDFPGRQSEWSYSCELKGKNYQPGDHYKFLLTLTDSTSQVHQYEIEGVNLEKTIKKL